MLKLILIITYYCLSCVNNANINNANFLGCYTNNDLTQQTFYVIENVTLTVDKCIKQCSLNLYKYSIIETDNHSNNNDDTSCICNNYLGKLNSKTVNCNEYCKSISCNDMQVLNLSDVYSTGLVPGPPKNLKITNITDTSLHMSWEPPDLFLDIISYQIKAIFLKTYSDNYSFTATPLLAFPNNTFKAELILLRPASKYNITLWAQSKYGDGIVASQIIETEIGDPDQLPIAPTIINHESTKITLKINPIVNNNGPISLYLVVVVNSDAKQIFQDNLVKSYEEARKDGINYYIAAELKPNDIDKIFTIGDGHYYGRYYNAPLDPNINYDVIIGVVSRLREKNRTVYSKLQTKEDHVIILDTNTNSDSPAIIIALSIAIGLLSFMFIAGIIGFIILKSRITSNRRHRLSDNQELTLQGPMIEVENNGYIPEEELNRYKNLKQRLRLVPYNQLTINNTVLGTGKFGKVNSGIVSENNVAIYNISDKKMNQEDKTNMLRDLDILIRTGPHEYIISLIGTCETPQMLYVILEYISLNLKDLLLGSRDSLPGRFSNMSESQAIDIAINIADGMKHLESKKIIHKQLCARSILITNDFQPKISEYGLAQYYSHNNLPDYTRWTAIEIFKGQVHNVKSDVWSFACLLWEICVLGGTPYGNFQNNEIPDIIMKGLRLHQLPYFSDDIYQLMLNCWQIDMDERPTFIVLLELLRNLKRDSSLIPFLNFNLYSNYQYEQYYPDMEIAVRRGL